MPRRSGSSGVCRNSGLCRNSATGLPFVRREFGGEPVQLLGLAGKARIHDQRIQPDEAPAGGLELPAVLAERRNEGVAMLFRCRMRRRLCRPRSDCRRYRDCRADSGRRPAAPRAALWRMRDRPAARGVPGDVAAVDDEIGPVGVDMLATRWKFSVRLAKRAARERWVSEIWVRRNSVMRASLGDHTGSIRAVFLAISLAIFLPIEIVSV